MTVYLSREHRRDSFFQKPVCVRLQRAPFWVPPFLLAVLLDSYSDSALADLRLCRVALRKAIWHPRVRRLTVANRVFGQERAILKPSLFRRRRRRRSLSLLPICSFLTSSLPSSLFSKLNLSTLSSIAADPTTENSKWRTVLAPFSKYARTYRHRYHLLLSTGLFRLCQNFFPSFDRNGNGNGGLNFS